MLDTETAAQKVNKIIDIIKRSSGQAHLSITTSVLGTVYVISDQEKEAEYFLKTISEGINNLYVNRDRIKLPTKEEINLKGL